MAEKQLSDVKVNAGKLKELGWPDAGKIASAVSSGKVPYATAVQRLNYLANITKDRKTEMKARSIIKRLQSSHKPDKEKK